MNTTPGACIIKLITAIINYVTQKASVFVKTSKKWRTIENALAYCTTELITAVKSFMIHSPEVYLFDVYDLYAGYLLTPSPPSYQAEI